MELDFREIAAKWAKQYANRLNGLAIEHWAKMVSGDYLCGYTEGVDPEPSESDFTEWLDKMFPQIADFSNGRPKQRETKNYPLDEGPAPWKLVTRAR